MDKLENIKKFDEYSNVLNEELDFGEQKKCESAFIRSTPIIKMPDGKEVKAIDIVNAVRKATEQLSLENSRTYAFAQKTLNIIYLAHSNKHKTMSVDSHMNLYMNAEFIYSHLKMDPELIGAVIMHEAFHALYKHIERGENWLAAKGKKVTPQTWHDTNLAADVEVNRTLVRCSIITEDRLVNEINGLYLKKIGGDTGVVPLEQILDNEKYMNILRQMCPPPVDPQKQPEQPEEQKINTTEEWNQGYKDAWNKIAELIKKYGHKGAWRKLVDSGLVNEVGEIYTDHETEDIMGLELLIVKSFEDYVNEDLNVKDDETGKTYKDGFMNAFGKLVNKLYDTINPSDGPVGGGGHGGGPKLKSDLPEDELEPIEFPGQDDNGDSDEDGGEPGVPEPIVEPGGEPGKKQKSKQGGKGGKGKTDDELTDDDRNELANDIEKRTNGGNDKISTKQEVEFGGIGGTGSFSKDGLSDDELREAGYKDEDIDKINEARQKNAIHNTPAGINRQIDRFKRDLDGTKEGRIIKQMFDKIEVEANKYKNIWRTILEEFMAKNTRRAGKDLPNGYNDWVKKKSIARGEFGIHHRMTAQDPQDVNVYVDVSGSMDKQLLEIICKSLVIFTQEWEYSGINICPWASSVGAGGVHKIEDFYDKDENEITKEILQIISEGYNKCGGGTDSSAAIGALLDCVEETLKDEEKEAKDDIHIIITDGCFDVAGFEQKMKSSLMHTFNRPDVAENAPEHTFWMVYDANDYTRKELEEAIKEGKLIFIVSDVVKGNG